MAINVYSNILDIKNLWDKLYLSNDGLSWFQKYEWNEVLYKKNFKEYCIRFYVIDDLFIAPLMIDEKAKTVYFLGEFDSSDYLSFIFPNNKEYMLKFWIIELLFYLRKYEIKLSRINENNIIKEVLIDIAQKNDLIGFVKKECVHIPLTNIQNKFVETLSKGNRQNYRTAINRIKKDNFEYKMVLEEKVLEPIEALELFRIYNERRMICDTRNSILKQILFFWKKIVKKVFRKNDIDIITEFSKNNPVLLGKILIDNQIAAFFEGQYNNMKTVSISRVATKREFYKYSPGIILFVDAIDSLKNDINIFDLTRGTEEYKFKLGGIIHYNYSFKVERGFNE